MQVILTKGLTANVHSIAFNVQQQNLTQSSLNTVRISYLLSNGKRTEWSPIRSVIIRVITKSDDRAAGVRFVNHEYDYRPNWMTRSLITN